MRTSHKTRPYLRAATTIFCAALTLSVGSNAPALGNDRETLRAVSLLVRHGVISPKYALPKVKSDWPMGFMQLTAVGIQMTYAEGQALRRKYIDQLGLISPHYHPSEVRFRASNTDRSLQSAQTLALGLFPLGTGPDPSIYLKSVKAAPAPNLAYAPVPVHSVSLRNDYILRPWTGDAQCTRYRSFVKGLSKTKLYRDQANQYSIFLQRIAKTTGVSEGEEPSKILYEVNEIYEPLSAMVAHGMALPKEISAKDMELLELLSDWNYHYQFLGKQVGRLTGGPFVGEILANFTQFIKNPAHARKMNVYSGHQRTIVGVEAALGIETARTEGPLFKGRVPPLGSHYAFELHEMKKGEYAIRLSFSSNEGEKTIRMPGCSGDFCPLREFQKIASAVVPKNWRGECAGK